MMKTYLAYVERDGVAHWYNGCWDRLPRFSKAPVGSGYIPDTLTGQILYEDDVKNLKDYGLSETLHFVRLT